MIKIDFEFDAPPYGTFRDALHLPDDHGLSDSEIDALKQRLDTLEKKFNQILTKSNK